jgi:hypothetical protein
MHPVPLLPVPLRGCKPGGESSEIVYIRGKRADTRSERTHIKIGKEKVYIMVGVQEREK